MEVSHKARKIIEAEISNRPSDSAAAIRTVIALYEEGLLVSDYWYRLTRDADQAEQAKP